MSPLDLVIAIPALGFLFALLIPRSQPQVTRWLTLAFSLVAFAASLELVLGYKAGGDRDTHQQGFIGRFLFQGEHAA